MKSKFVMSRYGIAVKEGLTSLRPFYTSVLFSSLMRRSSIVDMSVRGDMIQGVEVNEMGLI